MRCLAGTFEVLDAGLGLVAQIETKRCVFE
jgi:hypothetical protein